ncbi:YkgJ family cysteine cluster protein [Desulfoscipio gibsoniae]|uniref:Putative Fe-S oxidoreductase n=1 Tax=Desulfoscipio gibsoniae DSM 7213 TaxID=767817 RepID=R4KGC3_9FIRM|nr:YkgJ family cysteine cluster protein [Desulfoscipio gibsoniae]AGL00717.1 putative Fe-S oxidoreductase [Desulfoscipio gibsoniae DSM 7213]
MLNQSSKTDRQLPQGRHTEFAGDAKFRFLCHEKLACFNRCCRDINIFLSPYDVLRMSRKLGLSTGEFLQRYTTRLQPGRLRFPLVIIKMREDADLVCPFVTERGCSVYDERPWSCRMAPVEIRGENKYGFAFDSDHCHGLLEDREWTVDEWMQNQGNDNYGELEQEFDKIPQNLSFTGMPALDEHIREMFYMTCYDLDMFRRYVFESSFLSTFGVDGKTAQRIKDNDLALLQFGFRWLARDFDLRKSMQIRDEVVPGVES